MLIAASPCPTTSCTSWAMRNLSSSAIRRAASVRSRWVASRLSRTVTPTANGTTAHAAAGASPSRPGLPSGGTNTCSVSATSATPQSAAARRSGDDAATV